MKKAILTFLSLFIAWMSINAQSNFRPGYIITNEKDTISGLIDFRTYKMNADICRFKSAGMGEEKVYYPENIYGYRFTDDGKYYVSHDIEIEGQQKKVFLEYLIQGIICLFFYPGDESDYYFFRDESGKMIPVTKQDKKGILKQEKRSFLGDQTGLRYNSEDNRYKGIVRYIFKESKSVSKATDKMSFNQNELIKLTKKYHAEICTTGEECIEFTVKPDKYVKTKVSVYAGMQKPTLKVGKRNRSTPIPDVGSLSPGGGVQLDFSVPRWNKSISFQTDISLFQIKGEEEVQFASQYYSRLKVDGFVIPVKLGGKYTYHKGLFRPVIEGGFMINTLFASSYYYYAFKHAVSLPAYEKVNFLGGYPQILYGLYAGVGLDYRLKKDNFLLFRIVYDACRTPDPYSNVKLTAWQIKLGYTF